MLRSVRGGLLKICQTEGPPTLGEMVSHTGDPDIPVIMVCHTEGPHTPGKTVSHTGGTPGPYSPGNMGTWVPIFT